MQWVEILIFTTEGKGAVAPTRPLLATPLMRQWRWLWVTLPSGDRQADRRTDEWERLVLRPMKTAAR